MKTIQVQVPESLLLHTNHSWAELEKRSQFLLALKFFELGQLSSGQAARSQPLGSSGGRPSPEEIRDEFGHA